MNEGGDATFMRDTDRRDATSTADVVVEYQVGGDCDLGRLYGTQRNAGRSPPDPLPGSSRSPPSTTPRRRPGRISQSRSRRRRPEAATWGSPTLQPTWPQPRSWPAMAKYSLSISDAGTVNEGEEAVFAVEIDGTLDDDLEVTYNTGDPATIGGNDYSPASDATLTMTAGQGSATIKVSTLTDMSAENNEAFTVTVTESHANVRVGTGTATATIRDDDPLRFKPERPKIGGRRKQLQCHAGCDGRHPKRGYDGHLPGNRWFPPDDVLHCRGLHRHD